MSAFMWAVCLTAWNKEQHMCARYNEPPTNCGAHLAESIFQTRSKRREEEI